MSPETGIFEQSILLYPGQVSALRELSLQEPMIIDELEGEGGLITDLVASQVRGDDRIVLVAKVGSTLNVIYASLSARAWVSYKLELGTSQVRDLSVALGSRVHVAARVNDHVQLWRLHPQTGVIERELSVGSQVSSLKTALNGDQLGLLYLEQGEWRWCVTSSISYALCQDNPGLTFLSGIGSIDDMNLAEAKIEPRTWLIASVSGGMVRGVTLDLSGQLINTGTITLTAPPLAALPKVELERFGTGGLIASAVEDGSPVQAWRFAESVYPITELGVWQVGENLLIDRAEPILTSPTNSRWGLLSQGDYETGAHVARLIDLGCQP